MLKGALKPNLFIWFPFLSGPHPRKQKASRIKGSSGRCEQEFILNFLNVPVGLLVKHVKIVRRICQVIRFMFYRSDSWGPLNPFKVPF